MNLDGEKINFQKGWEADDTQGLKEEGGIQKPITEGSQLGKHNTYASPWAGGEDTNRPRLELIKGQVESPSNMGKWRPDVLKDRKWKCISQLHKTTSSQSLPVASQ